MKAYINIAKEVRRKDHKGRAELAIFVGFEESTIPGYKFNSPLFQRLCEDGACALPEHFFDAQTVVLYPFDSGSFTDHATATNH